MIKLGDGYLFISKDIRVVDFVDDRTVVVTFRSGEPIPFQGVPEEDVARFRQVWDRYAADYEYAAVVQSRELEANHIKADINILEGRERYERIQRRLAEPRTEVSELADYIRDDVDMEAERQRATIGE